MFWNVQRVANLQILSWSKDKIILTVSFSNNLRNNFNLSIYKHPCLTSHVKNVGRFVSIHFQFVFALIICNFTALMHIFRSPTVPHSPVFKSDVPPSTVQIILQSQSHIYFYFYFIFNFLKREDWGKTCNLLSFLM